MKKLIIISPNDRYNYGDLLFSFIIQSKLKTCYSDFIIVSTTNNDLTSVGGEKVLAITSLSDLDQSERYDLILGGGESLLSDWLSCCRYCTAYKESRFSVFGQRIIAKLFGRDVLISYRNTVGRKRMHGITEFPFSISKNEISYVDKIFYCSVGAAGVDIKMLSKSKIKKLKKIDYISVRDINSSKVLNSVGVNAKLRPDSAILMSEVFGGGFLEKNISDEVALFSKKRYILFQINLEEKKRHTQEIIDFLASILKNTDLYICLCPIGYAPGHDDPIALSEINDLFKNDKVQYFGNNSIWDIMYLIANSKCYVGSSLHGVITSMSFNIPYVALYRFKTISYINLWGGWKLNLYNKNKNLYDMVKKAMSVDKAELNTNRTYQLHLANQLFNEIINEANK